MAARAERLFEHAQACACPTDASCSRTRLAYGNACVPRPSAPARRPRAPRPHAPRARAPRPGPRCSSPGARHCPSLSPRWLRPCVPAPPLDRGRRHCSGVVPLPPGRAFAPPGANLTFEPRPGEALPRRCCPGNRARAQASTSMRPGRRRTGSAFPFNSNGSTSSASTAADTSAYVAVPISTSPGSAACSSRAATFIASPVASISSVVVTTTPVLTPIRPRRPSSGSASRISTAARQARSASSSRTTGTPNTATTASPMNFSTVPPCRSTIVRIRSR